MEKGVLPVAYRFDFDEVFDEDYLYFYSLFLTDEQSDREVGVIWRLLELEPGMEVLDLACGHGRIANRLAARGCRVTGLDASDHFLSLARAEAETRGLPVAYHHGDMRSLPWTGRFDRVISWFTAFGYFEDDDDNRRVLAEAYRALKPGGRLLIDHQNLLRIAANWQRSIVWERDGDFLIDHNAYDPLSGRSHTQRIVIRGSRVRRMHYSIRMFTLRELADWLRQAGFREVAGYGAEGEPLTVQSRRMIAVATK
ncbi:MAG TPA: class I SAM-dependent methyltransferase [Bacillota bacterium]